MKKSKLQVMIEFLSQVHRLKSDKKEKQKDSSILRDKKAGLILLAFIFIHSVSQAVTYYSRSSGNWNVSSTWSTVGYGNAVNSGTYPQAGDIVNIGNGYTITISSAFSCATLNVGQGISGTLEYLSTGTYVGTITGNITVNTGARIWYNSPVNRTHQLLVGGNFSNFGTVDFYFAPNQVVNIIFNTSTNSIVTGTGTWDLNNVTMSKSVSRNTQLSVSSNSFETGIRNFIGTYGTYVHNNTGSYNINPTTSTFTIGPNVIFRVPMGIMRFASLADNLVLQGALYVSGGSVFVGRTNGLQGLRTDRNGSIVPFLEVTGGNLIVYGGITHGTASAGEAFSFRMTGGSVLLNAGTTGTNRQVFCVTDVPGSIFNMSGGTITLQKPNIAGTTVQDFSICGSNGTVTSTAGIIQFGNGVTAPGATFNFRPQPGATFPHFRVSGQAGQPNTLATSYSSTSNFRLLSLNIESAKTFDIRSIGGTSGDGKMMTLMGTVNGVDALFNSGTFIPRQSTVTFNTSGAQAIGGTVTTTFYNLSINNSSNITLNRAAIVNNYLSMVSGKLITTSTNVVTCGASANASLGTASSYVDGPMVHTFAGTSAMVKNFPVGKGSSSRSAVLTATHSDMAPVTYRAEIFNAPASALPFGYPASISTVSHIRYLRVSRQAVSNFTSGRMQMYYDVDDVVADYTTLNVAHDDGVNMWQNIGGTATANWTGSVTSGLFNSFNSYFALANPPGGGSPLPIDLTAFNASLNNNKVDLNWTTQSEINNDFYTIERSTDNVNFTSIGNVEGMGNSSTINSYSFTDYEPFTGISYYRISQTDFNGQTRQFPSRVINNVAKGTVSVYPNPSVTGRVQVSISELKGFNYLTVQDITGKNIPVTMHLNETGIIDLNIDDYYASKGGIFIISVSDGQRVIRQRLLIN